MQSVKAMERIVECKLQAARYLLLVATFRRMTMLSADVCSGLQHAFAFKIKGHDPFILTLGSVTKNGSGRTRQPWPGPIAPSG